MTEFQVFKLFECTRSFYLVFRRFYEKCMLHHFQTLRQKIDDEYREVVERRVITGSVLHNNYHLTFTCQMTYFKLDSIILIDHMVF